jgi:hypothetical protein
MGHNLDSKMSHILGKEDKFRLIFNVNKYPLLCNATKIIYFLVNFYQPSLTTVYKAIR